MNRQSCSHRWGRGLENKAIGGYFELELPASKAPVYPQALSFQSGRAAFLALLHTGKPRRVWAPYYICSTMLDSIKQAEVETAFYRIDDSFHLAQEIHLLEGDWFLYVNYFGLRGAYAQSLLSQFARQRVVIDASQALFSPPLDCLATIYSPRKFLGLPDGGLLVSSIAVDVPEADEGSFERALPLLKRMAFSPEAGYAEHQHAETTLYKQQPKGMSNLTRRMLSSVDLTEVCEARNRNFSYLHKHLGRHNRLHVMPGEVNGPLCYPMLTPNAKLREALIKERIFVATYWRDVLDLVEASCSEAFLVHGLVPLPCDQRYSEGDMARVVEVCSEFFATTAKSRCQVNQALG